MVLKDIIQLVALIVYDKRPDYVLTNENLNRVLDFVNKELFAIKIKEAEKDGRTRDELSRFKVVMGQGSMPLVFTNGIATKPDDCFYPLGMNDKRTGFKVDPASELEWNDKIGSAITKPTQRDPIYRDLGTQFQIAPSSIQVCDFVYYRLPNSPVYEPDGVDTEFEYDQLTLTEIVPLILKELGFSIPSAEVVA
jgi:hypothetical protein